MRWLYKIVGIIALGCSIWFVAVLIGFSNGFDDFGFRHKLSCDNLEVIKKSSSPDNLKVYYHYMFDQGGYGYSRSFWAVVGKNDNDLEPGIIADGYRIVGWTSDNALKIESFEPPYYKEDSKELKSGSFLNGVKLIIE